jgi:hypothetical protein
MPERINQQSHSFRYIGGSLSRPYKQGHGAVDTGGARRRLAYIISEAVTCDGPCAQMLDAYDPDVGYDAATFPYQPRQ